MYRLGVLISGRGSNLEAIAKSIASGYIGNAEIVVVVSNRDGVRGLKIAEQYGIEALFLNPSGLSKEEYDAQLVEALRERNVDLVVLAGFMRILSPVFIRSFEGRIVNIHPSLLPAFRGLHAQRQAVEAGVRFSGATVHFVTEELDAGPIIVQSVVPVFESDDEETLSDRILKTEHEIYPMAIKLITEGKVRLSGKRVVCDCKWPDDGFYAINPLLLGR